MKRLKYLSIFTMIFGAFAFACNEEAVRPLGTGDDEDEDPIIIPPPPPPENNSVPIDSLDN